MGASSNFAATLAPDDTLSLAAPYKIGSVEDRRLIDSQIQDIQRLLTDNVVRGLVGTWLKTNVDLQKGDVVCGAPNVATEGDENPERWCTLASAAAVVAAGANLGLVMAPATAGSWVRVAAIGIVGNAITGLASGDPGPVRVSVLGRCEKVASYSPGDFPVGMVDGGGNLTVQLAPAGPQGPAGASSNTSTTASFVQPAVNSNVAVQVGSTAGMAADQIFFIAGGGHYQVVTVTDATHVTVKNLGYPGAAAPAATVTSPARVTPSGVRGAAGVDGTNGTNGTNGAPGAAVANFLLDVWTETPVTLSGIQTIDGQAGSDGLVVGVNGQADQTTNGVYVMHTGAWTRHVSWDSSAEFNARALIVISAGTEFGGKFAFLNSSPATITLGSSSIKFTTSGTAPNATPEGHFAAARSDGKDVNYGPVPVTDGAGTVFGLLRHLGIKLRDSLRVVAVAGLLHLARADVVVLGDAPYYGKASTQSQTAAVSSGSAVIVMGGAADFEVGDGVFLPGAGADHQVPTAATPTLERVGTAGSVTRGYKIVWLTYDLGYSIASPEVTIANAPDTLMASLGTAPNNFLIRCNFATTGAIADFTNLPSSIDGVRMRSGLIGCVKNQAAPADNGIYDVNVGADGKIAATRRYTLPAQFENGRQVHIGAGTANKGKYFRQVSATVTTVGTDPITYEECSIKVRPYGFVADAATTVNLSNLAVVPQSMDGVTLLAGYVVLVKNQSTTSQNGLYTCGTPSGGFVALTRLTTFDQVAEMLVGTVVRVKRGTPGNGYNRLYMLTAAPGTVGTDPVVWQDFTGLISHGLVYGRTASGAFSYLGAIHANPMQETTGVVYDNFFEDRGAGGETLSVPTNIPATPPAAKRNDGLRARITGISGLNFTLSAAAAATVGSVFVLHDNYLALEDAMASFGAGSTGGQVEFAKSGTYPVYGNWKVRRNILFKGRGFKNTTIRFGAPHGLVVQGGTTSTEGSTGEQSIFENLKFTPEGACMPSGGYFVAPSLQHEQGAMILAQVRCHFRNCYVVNAYGNGIAVAGRLEEGSNANLFSATSTYVETTTRGHGWVLTGSDSNVANLVGCSASGCNGDGVFEDSFLGIKIDGFHTSANDNAGYHVNQGSAQTILIEAYSESGMSPDRLNTNTIRIGGNPSNGAENDAGLAIINRVNVTSHQISIGSPRIQYTIGDPSIDNLIDWMQQPTITARNALDHRRYLVNNDTIRSVFSSSLNAAWDWIGRNKYGSGRVEFPNGLFLNTAADAANVHKVGICNGGPTATGLYDKGWTYLDHSGEDFGFYVTAKYAITTQTWAASTSYVVGTFIDGGDGFSYLLKSITNNAKSGVSGGTIPSWTSGDNADNVLTWERWGALSATGNYTRIGRKTKVSGSLAFGTIGAGDEFVIAENLPGAAVGDDAHAAPQSGHPGTGLGWVARVSAADTVEITVFNYTAAPIASTNRTWRVSVTKN